MALRAIARRWLSGDERTLGVLLAAGVLTMAFFRLDQLRADLGVAPAPDVPLATVLVAVALAWWSMLPRGFVWLEPAVLTWRDFGGLDRSALVSRRLASGWLVRQLVLGYLLALLAALVAAPAIWTVGGAAVLAGSGLLALGTLRRERAPGETLVTAALATLAMVARPGPVVLFALAGVMAVAGVVLLARSGPPGRPVIATAAGRVALVDGWRERVLRTVGVQFLDLAMLLPPARPVRPRPLRPATGLRLAALAVLGRARHLPTAGLLALAAVAVHLTFPALPDEVVFALLGYLALIPLGAGLAELWRSPGRRRWVGRSNVALRLDHLAVLVVLAAVWAVPVTGLAALAGAGWSATALLTVPLTAACAVRTYTNKPPTFDNLGSVDTPFGAMPMRLILQSVRGPDVGLLAVLVLPAVSPLVAALVVVVVLALCVLR